MPRGETSTKIDPALLASLRQGRLVLVPAERIARTLRQAFNQTMQQEGQRTWAPANILTLQLWLPPLWHQLLIQGDESRTLLNRTQEQSIWQAILAADPEVSTLRSLGSLAKLASDAWGLLHLHNGRGQLRDFTTSTDARAFARWAMEFERRCHRDRLISAAQLPTALQSALAEGTLDLPNDGLTMVDFDVLPPAHRILIDSIGQAGYEISQLRTLIPSTQHLHTAANEANELRAAAEWCRERLEQDPAARIAIVLPDQADRRPRVERVFGELLPPNKTFEFSLGQPLAATELCASALDLLRWAQHPLPVSTISGLLLSPFCGGSGPEALASAAFDVATLRQSKLLRPELSLEALLNLLQKKQALPGLRQRLQALLRTGAVEGLTQPNRQPYGDWADAFRTVLADCGWTAATQTDLLFRQMHTRWESALDDLATLDFDGTLPTAAEALLALASITEQTTFAPESQDAPIQILGPLELGGTPFGALWFLGADDLSWPATPSAHPLIPWNIQSALGMPGADRTRDRAAARALTDRMAASAAEVIFSYAAQAEDGPRRPSALIASLPSIDVPQPPLSAPQEFIPFEDTLPIESLPNRVQRGGATILEHQAACPFRAFAEHRLHATTPEARTAGLDPRDRGTIVHTVMEAFWSEVRDQPSLRALTVANRDTLLDACIDGALAETTTAQTTWDRAYLRVQRTRLQHLLRPWLDAERERPPFLVREREEKREVAIGPVRLHLRIDRVDETELGPLILDYKTGDATPSDWLGERPDAPQLPLYAVLSPEPIAGVAFALLRAGKDLGLKGFADDAAVLAKPSRNDLAIADQVEEWGRILTGLAIDFANAEAAVDPKAYPATCKHCAQRILCRLDTSALEDTEDDEKGPAYG